jgi:hypothetical protein
MFPDSLFRRKLPDTMMMMRGLAAAGQSNQEVSDTYKIVLTALKLRPPSR